MTTGRLKSTKLLKVLSGRIFHEKYLFNVALFSCIFFYLFFSLDLFEYSSINIAVFTWYHFIHYYLFVLLACVCITQW